MLLSKILQKIIEDSVKKSFQNLRLNLLGPDYISKAIHFSFKSFDPATTIGSMYSHANAINSTDPKSIDKATLNKLKDVAENYVDALQEKSIADMNRIVGEKLDEISAKAKMQGASTYDVLNSKDGQSVLKDLRIALKDQKVKIEKAADVIVNHELHQAQNYGAFDGLLSAAKSMGISDPICFKIGVLDEHRCLVKGEEVKMVGGDTKKVEDIIIGDVLRSHKNINGTQDKNRKLNAIVESKNIRIKDSIEIEFDNGSRLRCSKDHPILVYYNRVYLFWPANDIVNSENVKDIDIVDIESLDLKNKKKMTANLNCSLATENGYKDFWSFTQGELSSIKEMYINGLSIVRICKEYKVDMKNEKYISALLKLSGVFRSDSRPSSKNNNNNKKYMHALTLSNLQKIELIRNELIADINAGVSGFEIRKKYEISISLFYKFMGTVDSAIRKKWLSFQKAKGGKASSEKRKSSPEEFDKWKNKMRVGMMRTALMGSRPQLELFIRLRDLGHSIVYNPSIDDAIRVDMIVDNKVVIEFDGSGHDMQVRMGFISEGKLKKNDYARDKFCKDKGYKVVRIKSSKDRIPSSGDLKILMREISASDKKYFEVRLED
jgi:very-short-patch-repair endonuclease